MRLLYLIKRILSTQIHPTDNVRELLCVFFCLALSLQAIGKGTIIRGKVLNNSDKPIPKTIITVSGRYIYANEKPHSIPTDKNGYFSISIPFDMFKIEVAHKGYKTLHTMGTGGSALLYVLAKSDDSNNSQNYILPNGTSLSDINSLKDLSEAYVETGQKYLNGDGFMDDNQAFFWFNECAKFDNPTAHFYLGYLYQEGIGVFQDVEKAIYWYKKAADHGESEAQFMLGEIYEKGTEEVKMDLEQAVIWYQKALDNGKEEAQDRIKNIQENPPQVTFNSVIIDTVIIKKNNKFEEDMTDSSFAKDIIQKQKRMAFIIGNDDYQSGRLSNPVNDATDLAQKLSSLGFETILRTNISTQRSMKKEITAFCDKAYMYDVALLYYAGHAVQYEGINYLKPTNAGEIVSEADYEDKYLNLPWIIRSMSKAGCKSNIVILDACRDEATGSFKRNSTKGLANLAEMPIGFVCAFATQAGKTAQDGLGQRNSPYMSVMLKELDIPMQREDTFFSNIKYKVRQLTKGKQIPVFFGNLDNEFYFNMNN